MIEAVHTASREVEHMTDTDTSTSALHDWDFFYGSWDSFNERLVERLVGSDEWEPFDSRIECWPILGGMGNVDTMSARRGELDFEGASLRVLSRETGLWSIYWLDNITGTLLPPVVGRFVDGDGEFFGHDEHNGVPVLVRFRWSGITPTAARWEQAFSTDGGDTWETNWTTTHMRRAGG